MCSQSQLLSLPDPSSLCLKLGASCQLDKVFLHWSSAVGLSCSYRTQRNQDPLQTLGWLLLPEMETQGLLEAENNSFWSPHGLSFLSHLLHLHMSCVRDTTRGLWCFMFSSCRCCPPCFPLYICKIPVDQICLMHGLWSQLAINLPGFGEPAPTGIKGLFWHVTAGPEKYQAISRTLLLALCSCLETCAPLS